MTETPSLSPSPFARYLLAKQSLDDRSLHPRLRSALHSAAIPPVTVLDVGCGAGASLRRLLADGTLGEKGTSGQAHYTGVDRDPELIALASAATPDWLREAGFEVSTCSGQTLRGRRGEATLCVDFVTADIFDFARSQVGSRQWSLLTAHAFLDLFDVDQVLDALIPLVSPDGLLYFSLNFDDLTVIEPTSRVLDDARVLSLYQGTMYRPQWGGSDRRGGSGRALFESLRSRGVQILDAAPSDWVIVGRDCGYSPDEQTVLRFLLRHIAAVVQETSELDLAHLQAWLDERLDQVTRGELVYIAHQLDVLAAR